MGITKDRKSFRKSQSSQPRNRLVIRENNIGFNGKAGIVEVPPRGAIVNVEERMRRIRG